MEHRNKSVRYKYFLSILLVFVSFVFIHQNAYANTGELFDVKFTRPLKVVEFQSWLTQYNGTPTELNFSHGEIQGGLTVDPTDSLTESFTKLKNKHTEFLLTAMSSIDEEIFKASNKSDKIRLSKLKEQFVLSQEMNKKGQKIDGARIHINNPVITDRIASDSLVEHLGKLNNKSTDNPTSLAATSYFVSPKLWYPTKGSTKTTKGLAFNIFYFGDASGFDSFNGILTYEHETQVYNTNFANYGGYWSSNLPRAYKDTQFLDTLDNFTIGSSKASDIVANTQYYTSMDLTGGSASSATVRIKGQLGHRYPSSCYSTWCIFADMTTPTLKSYTAPISTQVSWTYTP